MGQNKRTFWRSLCCLYAIALGLANPVSSQNTHQTGFGRSNAVAKIISIATVKASQDSRPQGCEPWAISGMTSTLEGTTSSGLVNRSLSYESFHRAFGSASEIGPLALFQSLSDKNWAVPDPTIAVGHNHVLVAVNSKLAFYNKCGDSLLFSTTLEAWFASALDTSAYDCGPYNPRLLYNHFDNTWLLAAIATNTRTDSSYVLFSASFNRDPTGNWYAWALNMSRNGSIPNGLQSYDLTLGLGANTVFLSTNQYHQSEFRYAKMRLFSVPDIADGGNLSWWDIWQFKSPGNDGLAFSVVPPICFDLVDSVCCAETRPNGDDDGEITLWEIKPDAANGPKVNSKDSIIGVYTKPFPTEQKGSNVSLHTGDTRVQSAIFRKGMLWVSFTTRGGSIDTRDSKIRIISFDGKNRIKKFDTTHSIIDASYFMPELAVDIEGNPVAFYYSSSNKATPAIEALILDPRQGQNSKQVHSVIKRSPQSFALPNWGTRMGMAIDPTRPKIIWGIGEVVDTVSSQNWTTWVAAISALDKPDLEVKPKFESDTTKTLVLRCIEQTIRLVVNNIGQAFAGKTYLGAYFSTDKMWSRTTDSLIVETPLDCIDPGKSQELDFKYTIGKNISSSEGFLLFVADNHEELLELDEKNNVLYRPVDLADSLICNLNFQEPRDGQRLCAESVRVEVISSIIGVCKPYTVECKINDRPAPVCTDTLIAGDVALVPGTNEIIVSMIVRDTLGLQDTCQKSIRVEKAFPLNIRAEILSPKPNSFFCEKEVLVTGVMNISGGFSPFVDSCWVNGKLVSVAEDTFEVSCLLPPGPSTIELICTALDGCGNFARDTVMVPVVADSSAPLISNVTLLNPPPDTAICGSQVEVIVAARFNGGTPPVRRICRINNSTITAVSDTIRHILALKAGKNTIKVICNFTDACNQTVSDTVSADVIADISGPVIVWDYPLSYPYFKGIICDSTGIKSIMGSQMMNAKLCHDNFAPGAHQVPFRIAPIDTSRPIGFIVTAVDLAGCTTIVDPVMVRLGLEQGNDLLSLEVPVSDHFFNIENHGLEQITLQAADKEYRFVADTHRRGHQGDVFYIPFDGGFTLDVQQLWQTENLAVKLTCSGQMEKYAYVIFSDKPWNFTTGFKDQSQQSNVPERFVLHQCYPNPFNPTTNIRFEIPAGKPRHASLKIYNLYGQIIATLLDGYIAPGYYEFSWHGLDNKANTVSSGVYFYVLSADDFHDSRKMTLAK